NKSHNNSAIPQIPKKQTVYFAPTNSKETGVIVSGLSKTALEGLVSNDKNLNVRIVNPKHGLYELFGETLQTVTREVDTKTVLVEQNSYVSFPEKKEIDAKSLILKGVVTPKDNQSANQNPLVGIIQKIQGVKLSGSQLAFVNSCKFEPSGPSVRVRTTQPENLQKTMTLFDLGQSVTLDGSQSLSNTGALAYQWLVTVPEDSLLNPTFSNNVQMDFTPDTTGMHIYSLVVKDANGDCDAQF